MAANEQVLTDEEFAAIYVHLIEAARENFLAFLHVMFPQTDEAGYIIGDLHEFLADIVQGVAEGSRNPHQAVSVPPQHGKSRLLAVRAVAWLIGYQPGVHIALTGFSHSLLTTFLREVRGVMADRRYQLIFPGIAPIAGVDRDDEVEFNNGSAVVVKSAGSKLTGRRVDWLFIDDAHAGRAEAESPTMRRRVIQWFFADCVTRLSEGAKVFLIGTRWHPSDLIGHLTSEDYLAELEAAGQADQAFDFINIPAISHGEGDPLGRPEGAPLFPQERSLKFLLGVKAQLPPYEWSSQYDGRPKTAATNQADLSKLRYIKMSELPEGLTITRGWDLALTEKQSADFTAGGMCGWDGHTFYIIDIFKRQWAWVKTRQYLISQAYADRELHNVQRIAIEGVAGFDAVYQDIKHALTGEVKVTKRNPGKGGKLLRAQPWLNLIEGGRVVIVRGPWNKDFLDELGAFPDAPHDDQVDSVSIAYEELVKPPTKLLLA